MSMLFTSLPSNADNQYFQAVWGRVFGAFIQSAREKAGMTVEQAARLTGATAGRWLEIEAGTWLPGTRQQLHLLAAALEVEWATMARIVLLCRQAWGIQ
jgi:transcriptional regulator with XRE-family HTH domain